MKPHVTLFYQGEIMNDSKLNIEHNVKEILNLIGEDPDREGLLKTPHRVSKMYSEVLSGYDQDLEDLVNNAIFDVDYDEMVTVKNIEFFSMCEHHMLPFFGKAHVAYLPNKKVIGLSKIPRIVDMFSQRLQVQERMTSQIADALNLSIDPLGVAVVVEGQHMCSMMRGVKKGQASMITSAMLGNFKNDPKTRNEFLSLLKL